MTKKKSILGILRVGLLAALFAISTISLFGLPEEAEQDIGIHLGPCQAGHLYFLSGGSHTGPCISANRYRVIIFQEFEPAETL